MTTEIPAKANESRWLTAVRWWIIYNACCSVVGWVASASGDLRGVAYLIAATVVILRPLLSHVASPIRRPVRKICHPSRTVFRRFRQPLPLIYLLILVGSLVGGILYAPSNYDMLTYRLPRMLHWLAAGRWIWIHASIDRMNYSGTGWEWAAMPLLLLGHGTRLLFLLNIISYILLPTLIFTFLRQLGVGGRTAWNWMWLLPTGLIFVTQAGGGANDTIAVNFALAAVVFALRSARCAKSGYLFVSLFAVAELTANKASNLPLLLPCAVALLPAIWKHRATLRRSPVTVTLSVLFALLVSAAPTLALNWHFTGDYAGSPNDEGKLKLHNPIAGLVGNGIMIVAWNLQPPVMPMAGKISDAAGTLVPPSIASMLDRDFPRFGLHIGELPQEEGSGLGLAITVMAVLAAFASITPSPRTRGEGRGESDFEREENVTLNIQHSTLNTQRRRIGLLICAGGVIALFAYMAKIGSESAARLIAPYYLFLLVPLLLSRGNDRLARKRWWKNLAILAAASALPGMILTPARPLFPAVRWSQALANRFPHSPGAARAAEVYAIYAARPDALASLRELIPQNEKTIGFVGGDDDSETSLWLPMGSGRKVYDILPTDTPATLAIAGVHYAIISSEALEQRHQTLAQVLDQIRATVITTRQIILKVSVGPQDWYVVRVAD